MTRLFSGEVHRFAVDGSGASDRCVLSCWRRPGRPGRRVGPERGRKDSSPDPPGGAVPPTDFATTGHVHRGRTGMQPRPVVAVVEATTVSDKSDSMESGVGAETDGLLFLGDGALGTPTVRVKYKGSRPDGEPTGYVQVTITAESGPRTFLLLPEEDTLALIEALEHTLYPESYQNHE